MTYTAKHKVDTTAKSFEIIERLCSLESAGVSELSDDLDMSKSIVHNHLSTLRELGYVRKVNGEYRPSLRFLELGVGIRDHSPLFHLVEQRASIVAKQFDTVVYLLERDGLTGVITQIHDESNSADSALGLGERYGLLESPMGVALLSVLPADVQDAAVEEAGEDPRSVRENTPLDRDVYDGTLTRSSETVVATGLSDGLYAGSLGIRIPENASEEIANEIRSATSVMSNVLSEEEDGRNRSFATTKHSWFSG